MWGIAQIDALGGPEKKSGLGLIALNNILWRALELNLNEAKCEQLECSLATKKIKFEQPCTSLIINFIRSN